MSLFGQRRLLFGYNFLFAVFSIYMLMLGIVLNLVINKFKEEFPSNHIRWNAIVLIVMGALMLLVCGVGWWGAFFETTNVLIVYAVSLLAFAAWQLILMIVDLETVDEFQTYSQRVIQHRWQGRAEREQFWNNLQRDRKCCGLNGPEDWAPKELPQSCCPRNVECTLLHAYRIGCEQVFHDYVEYVASWVVFGFLIVIVGEIVGATLAILQVLRVRKEAAVNKGLVPDSR